MFCNRNISVVPNLRHRRQPNSKLFFTGRLAAFLFRTLFAMWLHCKIDCRSEHRSCHSCFLSHESTISSIIQCMHDVFASFTHTHCYMFAQWRPWPFWLRAVVHSWIGITFTQNRNEQWCPFKNGSSLAVKGLTSPTPPSRNCDSNPGSFHHSRSWPLSCRGCYSSSPSVLSFLNAVVVPYKWVMPW